MGDGAMLSELFHANRDGELDHLCDKKNYSKQCDLHCQHINNHVTLSVAGCQVTRDFCVSLIMVFFHDNSCFLKSPSVNLEIFLMKLCCPFPLIMLCTALSWFLLLSE